MRLRILTVNVLVFYLFATGWIPQPVHAHTEETVAAAASTIHNEPLTLLNHTLVREVGDPKVYYIQDGTRRWIPSEAAFFAQGFQWSDVTVVDHARLASYPLGLEISSTPGGLALERALLPDLAPVAPYDLRIVTESGRTRLRFTATFINRGKGALELNAHPDQPTDGDGSFSASQRIFRPDGSFMDRPVGVLFWHAVHDHYHYDDFGHYILEPVLTPGSQTPPATTQKTTFCLRDDLSVGATVDGAKQAKKYNGCRGHQQGVSVGWADQYPYTLDDQFIDITDLPPGKYKLSFIIDSTNFSESRRDNNISSTIIELNPPAKTFKTIAVAAPYDSPNISFPNGMLVSAEEDPRIYVIQNGKKRWLRTEQVFLSYGNSWGSVLELPGSAVSSIPNEKLIRLNGSLYVLNDAGYKRKILNPSVLASYGWTNTPSAEVNQTEFNSIPSMDLVMKQGTNRVYSISSRTYVGTLTELSGKGLDPASVHVINETDFGAYAVEVVTQNLNVPWDIVFLPDGDMLVTERVGTLRRIGKQAATISLPDVLHTGEGGLMGMALHPDFASNQLIYLYFTTNDGQQKNRVMRFKLNGTQLVEDKLIIDNIPSALYHDGGQIAFGPDGFLYITTGDAETPALAQDLNSLAGKTLRLTADGGIPGDNPFGTAVWSYGHRNAQGITWDAQGRQWQTEHGRSGALSGYDELNLIVKGGNYGWPNSQGDTVVAGTIGPVKHSGASETWAPAGIAYVNGHAYFAGLRGATLYKATFGSQGNVTAFEKRLSGTYGRLRAVVPGPNNSIYVSTSNRDGRGTPKVGDDKILRIYPDFF